MARAGLPEGYVEPEPSIFRFWNVDKSYIDIINLGGVFGNSQSYKITFLLNNLYQLLNQLLNPIPGDDTNWYLLKNNVIEADTSYNRDLYKTFDFINNLKDSIIAQIRRGYFSRIEYDPREKEMIYKSIVKLRQLVREFPESDFIINPEVNVLFFIRYLDNWLDHLDMADQISKKYYQKYLKYKSKYLELKQKLNK